MNGHQDTRTALLDAATPLFAEKGYDATSVREITASAGANLGAITYHFGSKAALFEEIMVRAQSELVERMGAAIAGTGSALDRVERAFTAHFTFLADHPDFRRLAGQMLLREGSLPPRVAALLHQGVGILVRLIVEGQREGTIRPGDPRAMVVAVMAPSMVLNLLRAPMRAGPGLDLDDPAGREAVHRDLLTHLRAGLTPREV